MIYLLIVSSFTIPYLVKNKKAEEDKRVIGNNIM
jgi:hypothetical protein